MIEVGQRLWCVETNRNDKRAYEVVVKSIGRKWAVLNGNNGRMNLETLRLDGGQYGSPGRCYEAKEDYEAEVAIEMAWRKFRNSIDHKWTAPAGVTLEAIEQARLALGIAAT